MSLYLVHGFHGDPAGLGELLHSVLELLLGQALLLPLLELGLDDAAHRRVVLPVAPHLRHPALRPLHQLLS